MPLSSPGSAQRPRCGSNAAFTARLSAARAAGVIHTDFERGFIRAEVTSCEEFVSLGGEQGALQIKYEERHQSNLPNRSPTKLEMYSAVARIQNSGNAIIRNRLANVQITRPYPIKLGTYSRTCSGVVVIFSSELSEDKKCRGKDGFYRDCYANGCYRKYWKGPTETCLSCLSMVYCDLCDVVNWWVVGGMTNPTQPLPRKKSSKQLKSLDGLETGAMQLTPLSSLVGNICSILRVN